VNLPLPTRSDVLAAANSLRDVARRTPLVEADHLLAGSEAAGAHLYLKLESLQHTGAFKFRGAYNRISNLPPRALKRGLITASSGNHALGLSRAARLLGAEATVVMPEGSSEVKAEGCRALGATVLTHGEAYDDAYDLAREMAGDKGLTYVHSFDDPFIISGQGTIGLEIWRDLPGVETILAPIGGGGLIAGLLTFYSGKPAPRIVGIEAEGAPSMLESIRRGELTRLPHINTVADGIATKSPGEITFSIVKAAGTRVVTVSDRHMLEALSLLLLRGRVLCEAAGAAPLAALISGAYRPFPGEKVVAVVTGGNISPGLVARILEGNAHGDI